MHTRQLAVGAALAALSVFAVAQTEPQGKTVDLQQTFHTRSPWQLSVTEGKPTKDYGDNDAPGALTLCLRKGRAGHCDSAPVTLAARATTPDDPNAWEPHYLFQSRAVYPRGKQSDALLMIVTGSLNSGNGDQLVSTQLLRYDATRDAFERVYGETTGRNNNQEIRFVEEGSLQGSVIRAEPQKSLPYGFWITVKQPNDTGTYREVLRFASATKYNDGNQLAVIDSEMPTIQQRLGVWKPGDPLPVPRGKKCAKPTLKKGELWCQ